MRKHSKKKSIGWVITDQLDTMPYWPRVDTSLGGIALARLHWIAQRLNRDRNSGLVYDVYKPWRRYDALVFLKSMGQRAESLARRYRDAGKPVVFDANVNYYTIQGTEHYKGMLPTLEQKTQAIAMTNIASTVVADSQYIVRQIARFRHGSVKWIPDNVETDITPLITKRAKRKRLRLVWCGESIKLFEFLVIENVLREVAQHIELVIVTNADANHARWRSDYAYRLKKLFAELQVEMIRYTGLDALFEVYNNADIVVSPRFLDNSYNLGHSEWKISLGLSCGCPALVSAVPSYVNVAERSSEKVVTLCAAAEDWHKSLNRLLIDGVDHGVRQSARQVVIDHYSSRIIANEHVKLWAQIFEGESIVPMES